MADPTMGGWALTPIGTAAPSTLTPQQVAQIQHTTAAMQQPQASPQQSAMMSGLFGPQGNLGQNLGSMGQAVMGGPAYGGGNIFSGDAYGGSAANPLAGLTAADYG